jgi:hypothetical protein
MSGTLGQYLSDVASVAGMERRLACSLSVAAKTIDHMDCFDDEQRSEIYSILQALRQDTAIHCGMVGQWVSEKTPPSGLGGATQNSEPRPVEDSPWRAGSGYA